MIGSETAPVDERERLSALRRAEEGLPCKLVMSPERQVVACNHAYVTAFGFSSMERSRRRPMRSGATSLRPVTSMIEVKGLLDASLMIEIEADALITT